MRPIYELHVPIVIFSRNFIKGFRKEKVILTCYLACLSFKITGDLNQSSAIIVFVFPVSK